MHFVRPYEYQLRHGRDRSNPTAARTAIQIQFPKTFSKKAWSVISNLAGEIYLYSYNGKFVATDETLELTKYGDGTYNTPYGSPRFVCRTLDELEHELEELADFYDELDEIPGWEKEPWNKERPVLRERSTENVMVTMRSDGDFIGFCTYDRLHGSQGRFLISNGKLRNLLKDAPRSVLYDEDCGNFVKITRLEETLWFSFTWLDSYDDGTVNGFRQDMEIPFSKIRQRLDMEGTMKYLYRPKEPAADIIHTPAASTIRGILQDKLKRHAFSKAMRDQFRWPREQVTLYPDGKYSFFFKTRSGYPKCGGLILHEVERDGRPYVHYSIHT